MSQATGRRPTGTAPTGIGPIRTAPADVAPAGTAPADIAPAGTAPADIAPAGIALAAGAGTRLQPLTGLRPKALCPVGGRALVDLALDRLAPLSGDGEHQLAVNANHQVDQMRAHAARTPGRFRLSVEPGEALGTAGGVARLKDWVDGRDVLVTNADCYLPGGLPGFATGWDGERSRLLCLPVAGRPDLSADFTGPDGAPLRYVGACLLPWSRVKELTAEPSGLYEVLWKHELAGAGLDLVTLAPSAVVIDCGTPADYLAANLHASGGRSVVDERATVLGVVRRSVVWDGAFVGPQESLDRVIRAGSQAEPVTVRA